MAIGSLLLGFFSLLLMIGGVFFTPVPYAGAALSFGAPVVSLAGIVMAGIGMSRAKEMGEPGGAAVAGLVLNIIAFVFGLVIALTCGLCNAACTQSQHEMRRLALSDGGLGGGGFGAELHRLPLAHALRSMSLSCARDPSGAENGVHFHPSVAAQLQGESCQVSDKVVQAYERPCGLGQRPCAEGAQVEPSSPEAQAAIAVGLDPTRCFVYRSGDSKIVLCNDGQKSQILQWENVSAVR